MQPQEPCQHDGCTRPRTRLSVFCDEHHVEQLVRAKLRPRKAPKPDPCGWHVRYCRKLLTHQRQGVITADELYPQLADLLVNCGLNGESMCWPACLAQLPTDVAEELLAYLRQSTRPHGFFMLDPARIEAARPTQALFMAALEARLRDAGTNRPG